MQKLSLIIFIPIVLISCSKIAKENKQHFAQQVEDYHNQYEAYQQVDIKKAESYIDSIQIVSQKNEYPKGLGIALLDKSSIENIKGNYNLSFSYGKKALAQFMAIPNDTLSAKAYSAIGISYWQKGENTQALRNHHAALAINEKLGQKNESATNYNHISMVYQLKGDVKMAEEFVHKAMNIIEQLPPNKNHLSILHNMANIYGMQEKYEEALKLDSIGLKYCELLNIEFSKSKFFDNMANCYYYDNKLTDAIEYHLKAIAIDSSFGNNKQLGDTYCNLGAIYEENNDYERAIYYYKKSIELCKNVGYKTGVKNALELLSGVYEEQGKHEEAYDLLKQSMQVKDSIINEASEKKIAEMQTLFDTEKKKQEIERQKLKISNRNISLLALGIIFILSLISYLLWHNRYKLKQEQRLQLELMKEEERRTQAILETEENERQRLARELHDGVGQMLTATRLNLSALNTTENNKLQNSISILDDSIKEIRNISHNMVPDVLVKFGLCKAINDFITRVNQTKKIKIEYECNGFKEDMLKETEKLMLYRIVQESVGNSIKYAHADKIIVQLSADEQEISLLLEDNGKGFDVENAKKKGGIGLKNIQLRTDYLKGKLEIESSSKGTTIIVEIPLS